MQGAKAERLERIIREARQQSGSPVDTKVEQPVSLEEALQMWDDAREGRSACAFVLSEREDGNTLRQTLEGSGKVELVGVAVGSEGGISAAEVERLVEKGLFQPVHFAVNILRCETAALYGLAAVQSFVNEIV